MCEQAEVELESIQAQIPHQFVAIDIESDPVLHQKYLAEIPVVEVGPYRLKAPFTRADLLMTIGAARDRRSHLDQIADSGHQRRTQQGKTVSGTDRFSFWLSRHWLAMFNFLFFLYVGLPFLAPVLMKVGATLPANVIYTAYSPLCHELGFRSFFLFGEQPYYPRASAGIQDMKTYAEATGEDENDILAARSYKGNEQVGYKVALCERDVAIYAAFIVFGIFYSLTGRRLKPMHWIAWLAIGIFPVGVDGFSQLFSQINLPFLATILPFRESTPALRVITGFLFGFSTAWFGVPYMEESMRDTHELLVKKQVIIESQQAKT